MENNRLRESTLRDLSRRARVNLSIVSRVLNQDPRLSVRAARTRILDTAQRVAYQPNGLARELRLQRTKTLAMLILDITNPVAPPRLAGSPRVVPKGEAVC
jgi:LacI family transcriptional regulator